MAKIFTLALLHDDFSDVLTRGAHKSSSPNLVMSLKSESSCEFLILSPSWVASFWSRFQMWSRVFESSQFSSLGGARLFKSQVFHLKSNSSCESYISRPNEIISLWPWVESIVESLRYKTLRLASLWPRVQVKFRVFDFESKWSQGCLSSSQVNSQFSEGRDSLSHKS